jgi:hypothetical protein
VSLEVSFDVTSSSEVSPHDETTLKNTVAETIGVEAAFLKSFSVISTLTHSRRRLLVASWQWAVSFMVVVALSQTDASSGSDFASQVTADLASDAFSERLFNELGVVMDSESIAVDAKRNLPISSKNNDNNNNSVFSTTAGYVLLALVVLVGVAVAVYNCKAREVKVAENTAETLMMEITEMNQFPAAAAAAAAAASAAFELVEMAPQSAEVTAPGSVAPFLQYDVAFVAFGNSMLRREVQL